MRLMRNAAAAVTALLLYGCVASSMAYRADYVPDKPIADIERITGRVLVYTTQSDDDRLVTARPTSFTYSYLELTTPIGMMSREI